MRSKIPLFEFEDGDLEEILLTHEQTVDNLKEYVEIIKKWIKGQPHLPVIPCDNQIGTFLILNKFSVEKCKKAIDMSFTVRGLLPEFYANAIPSNPRIKTAFQVINFFPFPKLGKEKRRVIYFGMNKGDQQLFNFNDYSTFALMIAELRTVYDISNGDEYILDHSNLQPSILTRFGPTEFKKMMLVSEGVYSARIKGVHIVNTYPALEALITMFKGLMKPKLRERFRIHKNYDSLLDHFSSEILPLELGGTEKSLQQLNEEWFEFLQEKDEFFQERLRWKVNENLRPEKLVNDDLLGFHGNFKRLAVD